MRKLETGAAWLLGALWILPLAYAFWTGVPSAGVPGIARFALAAPLTLDNFRHAWDAAPFARYFLNSFLLVTMVLVSQMVLCTLAAYSFARVEFPGKDIAFALVLTCSSWIMPDVLIVENYRTLGKIGLLDSDSGHRLALRGFGVRDLCCCGRPSSRFPRELDEAARVEGANALQILWRVYVPLARPTYLAFGLVSVSFHWNNFLWPLIVTSSVTSRPVTVGLQVFSSGDQGVDWSVITAATLMTSAPLLIAFLLFQRQFVQSFMRAGIR